MLIFILYIFFIIRGVTQNLTAIVAWRPVDATFGQLLRSRPNVIGWRRGVSLNNLGHLTFVLLDVLRVQRSVGEDKVVQGSIIDDAVDELHVMGDVTVRLDAFQSLVLLSLLLLCGHHERSILVALRSDQVCSVARSRGILGFCVRIWLLALGDFMSLAELRLLTVRSVHAEETLNANATDLLFEDSCVFLGRLNDLRRL